MMHSRRSERLRYPTKSLLPYFAASSEYRAVEVTLFWIPFGGCATETALISPQLEGRMTGRASHRHPQTYGPRQDCTIQRQ